MRIIFLLLLFLSSLTCVSGDGDSSYTCQRKWIVPDHFPLQFAGNIGFISGGIGYSYAKNKLETDLMYGFVPEQFGGPLSSITLKQQWLPFEPVNIKSISIDLFSVGLYFNYTLGKQFFVTATSKPQYPKNYYDYSSAIRTGFFMGGRLNKEMKKGCISKVGLYYELGTYDLALHNYIFNVNKSSFKGLFSLALGVKLFLSD